MFKKSFNLYYEPQISNEVKRLIQEYVRPAMVSPDGDTSQYSIGRCIEEMTPLDDVYEDDLKILKALHDNGDGYIEF